jgi:asparagine synthase (glutamine-hydrolysing)
MIKHQVETRSEAEINVGVRQHLLDLVRLRLRADVPVGMYLSGGIDSSAIAGIVTHLVREESATAGSLAAGEQVRCFSIAFDRDSGHDESGTSLERYTWLSAH